MRPFPPLYWLLSIIAMAVLNNAFPLAHVFAGPWRVLGLAAIVPGAFVFVTAFKLFKKHETPIRPFEESTTIITEGPFSRTRNPIYLGMTLILLGAAVFLGSLSAFLVIPLFVFLIHTRFVLKEEKFMERTFGSEYLAYRRRVRRWI